MRAEHPVFHLVAEAGVEPLHGEISTERFVNLRRVWVPCVQTGCQRVDKRPKRPTLLRFDRPAAIIKRAPILKFGHVFESNAAGRLEGCPLERHPRQTANLLLARLAAFGFAVVLAVRTEPSETDRLLTGHKPRMDVEDVFAVMLGRRMVRGVHSQRFAIVIDGDIDRSPKSHLDAGTRATTAGEVVDDQF